MCVEHLKRCKTSNSRNVCIGWFLFLLFSGKLPSLHLLDAGGTWHTIRDHVQRSYLIVWDTEPDQLCVPAPIFHCLWRPAKPSTGMSFFQPFFKPNNCTVFAIWLSCIRTSKSFEQGRRKISFAQFLTSNHSTIPVRFTEVFLHVRCIPHQ